jgi:hypothetical protein
MVDLYTNPSFAWVVYMDGEKLLKCCTEEIEVDGVRANALAREAEVAVAAAHAIYKEHMVLLIDCLTMWAWTSREVWGLAEELSVGRALETLHSVCRAIGTGRAEAPHRLKPYVVANALAKKFVSDSIFRVTTLNVPRYILRRREIGAMLVGRLMRKSY